MTAIAGTSSSFAFNKGVFSDPNMRSHLEKLYNAKYAPMRERIEGMKEAEANGQAANTVQTRDGKTATELSAAQYEAAIPSFDKWLDIQQNTISSFDFAKQSESGLKQARESLERIENALNPDQPSHVRTVFSDGHKILGYINDDGSLVTHEGGSTLQKIAEQADQLNLTGQAKIAYIQEHGAAKLSRNHSNVDVTHYNDENMPTKREFAQKWYPDHDVDAAYNNMLKEAKAFLEKQEAFYKQQMQNLYEMRVFLIQSMEEVQSAPTEETGTQEKEEAKSSAVEDFLEFMEMSPEERYIAQALADKGYTQEEFDALPPEEQEKIMNEIRQEFREKIENQAKSGDVGETADTETTAQTYNPSYVNEGNTETKPLEDYAAYPGWMDEYLPQANILNNIALGKVGDPARVQNYKNQFGDELDEYTEKLQEFWVEAKAGYDDIDSPVVKERFEQKLRNDSRMLELMNVLETRWNDSLTT